MDLRNYIEAASESSSRSRRVFTILLFATILAFGAFWNTRRILWSKSWMQNRIDYLTQEYKNKYDKAGRINKDLRWSIKEDPNCFINERFGSYNNSQFNSCDSLLFLSQLLKTKDIYYDNTYVIKVDAIGVSIDINDLGVYTSGAYCFLLVVLMYCLSREYFNLKIAFDYAENLDSVSGKANKNLRECYNLISMAQLWRVPPESIHDKFFGRFMKRSTALSSMLLYIPVINISLIVLNDVWTLPEVWKLSKYDTILSLVLTICFTVVFLYLIKKCRELIIRIKNEWDSKAEMLELSR